MSAKKSTEALSKPTWSVPVTRAEIPEEGKHFELAADEATRAEIARLASLRSLPRLQATFNVARQGSDGLRVTGEISATVGQTCVVTLEPLDNKIREEVDLIFMPPGPAIADADDGEDTEVVDPGDSEPLIGDTIDLGVVATDFLMLGIDPYPRKPGAKFEPPAADEDEAAHPFAALAALKKGRDGQE
jgi:uncharacterized metal-binding protein YceD (DUF177 family)